jgi:hypothetical protein
VDPKVLKINGPKFEAMRKGLKEAKDLREAVARDRRQHSREDAPRRCSGGRQEDLRAPGGPEELAGARRLLRGERAPRSLAPKGTTFQQIAEGIVQAAKGISPSEAALRRQLKQEREERAAAEAKAAKEREDAASADQHRGADQEEPGGRDRAV